MEREIIRDRKSFFCYVSSLLTGGAVVSTLPLLQLLFLRVGHHVNRSFLLWNLGEAFAGFLIVFLFFKYRYFVFTTALLLLPRLFSFVTGQESHNLLFPFWGGMALALLFRTILFQWRSLRKGGAAPAVQLDRVLPIILLFAFGQLLVLRAMITNYWPEIVSGLTVVDREIVIGVSANYGSYLTLLIALHIMGSLSVIILDGLYLSGMEESARFHESAIAAQQILLAMALSWTVLLPVFILQLWGIDFWFLGSGSSRGAGRLPLLFSDSGSSTFMLPILLYGSVKYIYFSYSGWNTRFLQGSFSRLLLNSLIISVSLFLFLFFSIYQGRGYFLVLLSILVLEAFFYILRKRFPGNRMSASHDAVDRPLQKRFQFFLYMGAGLSIVFITLLVLRPFFYHFSEGHALTRLTGTLPSVMQNIMSGNLYRAFEILDAPRFHLFQGGLIIFQEHPWIGSGWNSFMIQCSRPDVCQNVPVDNPPLFALGLLSDLGLVGVSVMLMALWPYFQVLSAVSGFMHSSSPSVQDGASHSQDSRYDMRYVYIVRILPWLFAAPSFIGYHLVHGEVAPFLLLPLFTTFAGKRRNCSMCNYAAIFLLLIYLVGWMIAL